MTEQKGPYVIEEKDLEDLSNIVLFNEQPTSGSAIIMRIRSRPLSEEIRKARKDVLDELVEELPNIERSYMGEQIDTQIETSDLKRLTKSLRGDAP